MHSRTGARQRGVHVAFAPVEELISPCRPHARQICVSFFDENGANTLKLDMDSAAGCPVVTLHNCRHGPLDPPDVHLLPLECFTLGNDCSQHTGDLDLSFCVYVVYTIRVCEY